METKYVGGILGNQDRLGLKVKKNKCPFYQPYNQILFTKPTKHSKPLFKIAKGRLLIVKKCKKNWCRVKTENFLGWVKTNEIWGLY